MYVKNKNGKHLVWVAYHVIDGPKCFDRHHHAFLEMSCVVRGTGTYQVNGEDFDMRPGDIFLFAPTDEHNLLLRNEHLEHIVIHLDPLFLWNALGNDMDYKFLMVFFQRNPHFRCRLDRSNPASPLLAQWFREIWQECQQQQDCYELMIKIKLQTILAQIIRSYDCIDTGAATPTLRSGDLEHMNQVLAYIEEHLDGEIRLAELAAIAHVSTSYFSTMFKQINGLPPVEYIVGQRIRRAIEYIRTTDMSLTDVAIACGFNNSTNFYKAFHRVTGRTPASYRKPLAYDDVTPQQQTVAAARTVFAQQQAPRTEPAPPSPAPSAAVPPADPCAVDPCAGSGAAAGNQDIGDYCSDLCSACRF